MYKWFLVWRYLHTKLIALFGTASVTLCVAMVLVVLSVMGGFLDTIRTRSRGLHSEIVLDGGSMQGFPYYEEFGAYVKRQLPEVVRLVTPTVYSYGVFRIPATAYTKPARVLGIRLEEYVQVNSFKEGLHYEHYYPGSTHFGKQAMPVAGFTEAGVLELPPDLEAANAKWRAAEQDPHVLEQFDEAPYEIAQYPRVTASPGQRVYSVGFDGPRYAGAERYGIVVGADLLYERRKTDGSFERYLARGAEVALTLMPLSQSGNVTGEPPVRIPLRYVDDSRTGIFEIDSLSVYVDFAMVQQKLGMDAQPLIDGSFSKPRANQILIGLNEGVDLNAAQKAISDEWSAFLGTLGMDLTLTDQQSLSYVQVYTWEDLQKHFINAVEKEKVLMLIILGIICLVAIALVGLIFFMIVEKKTRDIGILKALGASGRGVAALFMGYAGMVGITGAILGTIVGSLFVWNINDIQEALAWINPQLRVWTPDVYSFDRIPEAVKLADAIWVASVAVVASVIGSVVPAFLAGRVWPVDALRYE